MTCQIPQSFTWHTCWTNCNMPSIDIGAKRRSRNPTFVCCIPLCRNYPTNNPSGQSFGAGLFLCLFWHQFLPVPARHGQHVASGSMGPTRAASRTSSTYSMRPRAASRRYTRRIIQPVLHTACGLCATLYVAYNGMPWRSVVRSIGLKCSNVVIFAE